MKKVIASRDDLFRTGSFGSAPPDIFVSGLQHRLAPLQPFGLRAGLRKHRFTRIVIDRFAVGVDHAEPVAETVVTEFMGRSRTENILAVIELVVRKAQLRQKRGANVDLRGIRIYCSGGAASAPPSQIIGIRCRSGAL